MDRDKLLKRELSEEYKEMHNKIEAYVKKLFENAPKTSKTKELKEEIIANLIEKYNDLIDSGVYSDEAYNQVIANIGNIDDLIDYDDEYREEEKRQRIKSAKITAIAVMIYIISPVCVLTIQNEVGVILLLILVALATGLLVYNYMSKPKYIGEDSSMVEEFKEWKSESQNKHRARKSLISAMWSITVALYFVVSFLFGAWAFSWVIFLIGEAIEQIIKAYFDLKEDN